jgi:hypothetical protein
MGPDGEVGEIPSFFLSLCLLIDELGLCLVILRVFLLNGGFDVGDGALHH